MKTHAKLFHRFSILMPAVLAAGISLVAVVQIQAQCNSTPPPTPTSLDPITNIQTVVCSDSTTYTWAVNADPASGACSTVVLSQCNYFVPYYNDGVLALTIQAISPPSGQMETYTIWSNISGNVSFTNAAPGLLITVLDNTGADITGGCTIDASAFAPSEGLPYQNLTAPAGLLTITWPGSGGGCTPPAITTPPHDAIVLTNATATYTVVTSDSGATFQWKKGGANLTDGDTGTGSGAIYGGSTTATLTVANAGLADAAAAAQGFSCTVTATGGACSTNTAAVALVVNDGSVVCSATNSIAGIASNNDGTFTIKFAGTVGAQYQVLSSADLSTPVNQWALVAGSTTTVVNADGTWTFQTAVNGGAAAPQIYYQAKAAQVCP